MKTQVPALIACMTLLGSAQMFAQTSGVSHPETIETNITTAPVAAVAPVVTAPVQQGERAESLITIAPVAPLQSAEVIHPLLQPLVIDAADAGIVTTYPFYKNALSEGTILKARLNEEISTKTTEVGSHFSAQLSFDVVREGKIILPAGAVVDGRVTAVHGGRRIGGASSLHLQPDTITMPDGTQFRMNARVIDLDQYRSSRVNGEGTILRSDHAKATLAALSLTTGSAAVAGAMIGGGAGAAVGAGIGAGIGAVWWLKRDRAETLDEGTQIVFSLDRPMMLTPVKP